MVLAFFKCTLQEFYYLSTIVLEESLKFWANVPYYWTYRVTNGFKTGKTFLTCLLAKQKPSYREVQSSYMSI